MAPGWENRHRIRSKVLPRAPEESIQCRVLKPEPFAQVRDRHLEASETASRKRVSRLGGPLL